MLTHTGTKNIKTERLILRRYRKTDAKDVFESWAGDREVARYITFTPHVSKEYTKATLEKWETLYSRKNVYLWAIQLGDKVVGNINVITISDSLESCEIGFCLGREYWNQGIMTEAAEAVISFLFTRVGVHRIEMCHVQANAASGRIAEKCGMSHEGVKRDGFKDSDGLFHHMNCYGILKMDWEKNQNK